MLQSATNAGPEGVSRYRIAGAVQLRGVVIVTALLLAVFCFGDVFLHAQETAAPAALQPSRDVESVSSALDSSEEDAEDNYGNSPVTSTSAPSVDRIIHVLEQNPSLVEELKAQLAEGLQSEGTAINANDISDQMLYSQIASDARLRRSVGALLEVKGYLPEAETPSAGLGSSDQRAIGASLSDGQTTNLSSYSHRAGNAVASESIDEPTAASKGSSSSRFDLRPRNPRSSGQANASTDLPRVLHQRSPYDDLQSLRDLYTQIPDDATPLRRFGSDVFIDRGPAGMRERFASVSTLDAPLGPDYVVGSGDTLTINLWGGVTRTMTRTIDRDGRIFLPDAGSLQIAGLSLGETQGVVAGALKQQYRDAQVAVTVSGLRLVRVYVVGDVQRPGGYELSSLATPLSALYAAGGPTAVGSLRTVLHYRSKELVERVDLYDFLLHGIRSRSMSFQSGDTLLVPPAGPQVAVFGAVKRPAIYELLPGATTLATVVADGGGLTASASLQHITIERIGSNHQRETITLPSDGVGHSTDPEPMASFQVKDGDRIRVEPILPYSRRVVYLAGHVVRPGRFPYSDGMHLGDVLHSYQDLLPEPADRGEIVRLVAPDLHPSTMQFSVSDALIGNTNPELQPFDTIRIFGRYQVDAPTVTVRGEVLRPGEYPMSKGMTAAELVRMAGGFKRDALIEQADLTSYDVKNGDQVMEDLASVRIGAAVSGAEPSADVPLKPGDILSIHQITNWDDIGESVTIQGEVRFPGSYGFHDGERLSSVLRRAGGLLPTAYPAGAVLVREQVRDLQQQSRDELVRQIETNAAAARLSPAAATNGPATLQLISAQKDEVLSELKNHPPTGRMVIHITADIDSWANTPRDIELRRGDVLSIPKRPGFVLVTGQVYNATALTFSPGKSAGWYLSHAGGTNSSADRKEIFVIRANGSVVGRNAKGWLGDGVLSTKLDPGDVVVVPQKIIGSSVVWKSLLTAGQIAASVAITAGVAAAAL